MREADDDRTPEGRRRRAAALRRLAEDAPAAGADDWPALDVARQVFGGDRALLLAAHQRWQVTLLARLDDVLERGTGDPHRAVAGAVAELGRDLPGLATLLGRHADDPVLADARRPLARYVDQACPCGRPHPLVPAPPHRISRCAVRRGCARAARWARRAPASPAPNRRRADRLVPRTP